ncbi:MAG: head-tail connector protein [Treponema sp.]|nr:head-tail connector protein [Treponema sp.]
MILKTGLSGRDTAEALTRELARLKTRRRDFESAWEEAQRFVSSVVLKFGEDADTSGEGYLIPRRITGRPANYLETLVAGISGYSINPNIMWLKLGIADRDLEEQYGVKDWLEKSEEALYKAYNDGNLYSQMPALIESAATFGHGVMLVDEDVVHKKIRCAAMNPPEIYLDTNEYDEVDTVFREFYLTAENAAAYFGLEKLAPEIRDTWRDEESKTRPVHLCHAVYKHKGSDGNNLLAREFMYASVFMDLDNRHLIKEGGYHDFPYAVFTWKKTMGKQYGYSPAMGAVSDIKLLHKGVESLLEVAQLSARPPMNVPQKLQGSEQLVPDGRNYYLTPDQIISPVQVGANFPITIEITRDMEERIKDWFHVDFFLMLQQQSRQMTATEVVELQGEKAAVLSNMVTNLNYALQKIVQRSVDILFRQGKMPELPAALQRQQTSLKVDFIGILAQAQKKAHRTSGIMQGIQIMGALAQMARAVPQIAEAFDYVDASQILRNGFESGGMSQLAIREDEDVQRIRQARAEAQAAMEQQQLALQQQQELLKNYKQLNEPVNPDSPIGQLDQGGEG